MFRNHERQLVLFASHFVSRALKGQHFDSLTKDCSIAFLGGDSPRGRDFDARGWLSSTWTWNGREVSAIVHNEFQAHRFAGACEHTTYFACWYSFLTLARSEDGGATFKRSTKVGPIAAIGELAEGGEPRPRGFFGASNMLEHEGYVYALTMTTGNSQQKRGNCLIRARDPFDEHSWEILTEHGFEKSSSNVYEGRPPPICRTIKNVHGDVASVVRHQRSGTFYAISFSPGGKDKGNLTYTHSLDLITWSPPETIAEIPTQFSPGCQSERFMYPVLLDPSSMSPNFDTVGDEAYLLVMRARVYRCRELTDRQLMKWKVRFR
jgi:hypothetical protein